MSALSEIMGKSAWLAGPSISLADLHAAPMFALFRLAPEGSRLLGQHDDLVRWWERISTRPSFLPTWAAPRHCVTCGWDGLNPISGRTQIQSVVAGKGLFWWGS